MFEPLPRSVLADADADLNSRDMPFVSVHRSHLHVLFLCPCWAALQAPVHLRPEMPWPRLQVVREGQGARVESQRSKLGKG